MLKTLSVTPEIPLSGPRILGDEKSTWSLFKQGSEKAFEHIYDCYITSLTSYGMQIVHNQDFVEEVIQELFVNLWNKRTHLGDVSCIKAYLFSSLRREILRRLKRERRYISEEQVLPDQSFLVSESVHDVMIRDQEEEERVLRLRRAMQYFSRREREIIHLKFFQGMSYESIAEMLGLNLKYIYNTASRAYQKLRDHLES